LPELLKVFHELTPEKVDGLLKQYAFSLSTPALCAPASGGYYSQKIPVF
jgi:hypothetical protein